MNLYSRSQSTVPMDQLLSKNFETTSVSFYILSSNLLKFPRGGGGGGGRKKVNEKDLGQPSTLSKIKFSKYTITDCLSATVP